MTSEERESVLRQSQCSKAFVPIYFTSLRFVQKENAPLERSFV